MTDVHGRCPMGCGATLFLGDGGRVTCSYVGCPRPAAADELLDLPTDHHVTFDELGFTIEHPACERLEGVMVDCPLNAWCRQLEGAPVRPGRYLAVKVGDTWRFSEAHGA